MTKRDELTSKRSQELLAQGYIPAIVALAVDWAIGCAEGMANYVLKGEPLESDDFDSLSLRFLPRYLKDCENWMRSFGHKPKTE